MGEYIIAFAVAFIVSFFATPIAKKIAVRVGAVDIPKDERRMHSKPMALMGGLAILAGFFVSLFYQVISSGEMEFKSFILSSNMAGYFIGSIIIISMGIRDDIKPLSARAKFLAQILASVIVVAAGTRINFISNPFSLYGYNQVGNVVSFILTVLWVAGITNAINLLDGLDGLSAGVSAIAALSLFSVSVIKGQYVTAILTVILAGATLGFLPYNFNPANIFMGEKWTAFLGFTLAVISVEGTLEHCTAIAIAIPTLSLGLPIFDTSFAIIRRIVNKRPLGEGDKGHIHHRLINMGLSQKQSVTLLYGISGTLGLISIALADKGVLPAILLIIVISVFVIGGARYFSEMVNETEIIKEEKPMEAQEAQISSTPVANQVEGD